MNDGSSVGSFSFPDASLAWAMGIDKRRVGFSPGRRKSVSSAAPAFVIAGEPRHGTRRVGGFLLIKHKGRLPRLACLYSARDTGIAGRFFSVSSFAWGARLVLGVFFFRLVNPLSVPVGFFTARTASFKGSIGTSPESRSLACGPRRSNKCGNSRTA